MQMPETAVDENDFAARGKDQIRLAGQVFAVQPVAIVERVDEAANG